MTQEQRENKNPNHDDSASPERYHAWQFIPFAMPASLDDLHGKPDAVFTLPITVYWGPRRPPFDMTKTGDVIRAYTEIISHGWVDMQCELINRELLIEYWPSLFLDKRRVRPAWEERFPELKARMH